MSYKPVKSMLVNNGEKTGVVLNLTRDEFVALDTYAKRTDTARVDVVRNALRSFLERENGL